MSSLGIIPTYIRSESEIQVVETTLRTLRAQELELDVIVVDDCSPLKSGIDHIHDVCVELEMAIVEKPENEGFSHTVNVGLRSALELEKNAILINADMEFIRPFVAFMEEDLDSKDRPAAVVGALLLYPSGLVQHGGVYFSLLDRAFDHRFRYGPGALPEAHAPAVCPVTGALQFIRLSTLQSVGLYDEDYRMGFEDVDYCLRVFDADLECVYDPRVLAIHHESLFRGQKSQKLDDWQRLSLKMLYEKHGKTHLGRFVPSM